MSKEELERKKLLEAQDKDKPPFKTMTEGQLHVINGVMNPRRDRYPEFTNMQGSMVFSMAMGMMRERAADPTRNRLTEPLSEVLRTSYCQCQRGVGFKMAMLAGNVGLGMKSGESDDMMPPRSQSHF
jgi:hypothetical protein